MVKFNGYAMGDNCFYLDSMFNENAAAIVRPGQVFDTEKFVIKREDASRLKVKESELPVIINWMRNLRNAIIITGTCVSNH